VLDVAQRELGLVFTSKERRGVLSALKNGRSAESIVKQLRARAEAENEPDPSQCFDPPPQDPACIPVWTRVHAELEKRVNTHQFATWFRPLVPVALGDGGQLLRVHAPNGQFEKWIRLNYSALIAESVSSAGLEPLRVEVTCFRDKPPPEELDPDDVAGRDRKGPVAIDRGGSGEESKRSDAGA